MNRSNPLRKLPEKHPARQRKEFLDNLTRPKRKASKFQIRKALKAINKLNAFNNALSADAQELWDSETKFSSGGAIAATIQSALGYDDAQMDTFWASALAISKGVA